MTGIEIQGAGKALAQTLVTNDDLAKTIDTSDEWISSRTGILQRRFVAQESNADLAADAAAQALCAAGADKADIALCLVATFSADKCMPSTASSVAQSLGLAPDTICFDLNAACTGFLYALNTAYCLLAQHEGKSALVIGSEVLSKLIDMEDRSTCMLFGDGAGAVVMRRKAHSPYYFMGGRSEGLDALVCTAHERKIRMDGQAVFRFAVDIVPQCIEAVLQKANLKLDDIRAIVCHQANKRILEAAARRLHTSTSKFFMNLQHYGNTSAASIPLALCELNADKGDKIICVGFGAGLSYGAALFTL